MGDIPRRKTISVELSPFFANSSMTSDIDSEGPGRITFDEMETLPSLRPVCTSYLAPPLCIYIFVYSSTLIPESNSSTKFVEV